MRLSDLMSQMGLSSYAEVGLVLFMTVFAAVALRLFCFSSREEMAHAAHLPLADDAAPRARREHTGRTNHE